MKIEIKKLKVKHAEELRKCLNNKEVLKTLDGIKYPFTQNSSKKYIKESVRNRSKHEFAILYDSEFVGGIVLENPNSNKKIFEVGYYLGQEHWGKGIAAQALKEIVKFGFKELKLKKIWAGVISNNPASGRVLEKAGFKLEGKRKKQIFQNNRYHDEEFYGIINS